jgi:hypothetical protein
MKPLEVVSTKTKKKKEKPPTVSSPQLLSESDVLTGEIVRLTQVNQELTQLLAETKQNNLEVDKNI